MKTNGRSSSLHLCKQCVEIYPSPCAPEQAGYRSHRATWCRLIYFPHPPNQKKGKEKKGTWAGAAGGEMGTSEAPAPQPKVLLAWGHGIETPWNTGNQGNGSRFTPRAEPGLQHCVGRRDGAGVKPSESGTSLISWGFGSGSDLKSKEGFVLWSYFHHVNLQYLYICKKVIIKPMLNLCPSPFWESTVRSNTKNPNCKALFYCLFSTFLTLNCLDIEIPLIPRLLALY